MCYKNFVFNMLNNITICRNQITHLINRKCNSRSSWLPLLSYKTNIFLKTQLYT